MATEFNGLLTATVFLPAAGAVLLLLLRGDKVIRGAAVAVAVADLALALLVFAFFDRADDAARFQFVDQFAWIPDVGLKASYLLAVDGLSAPLVALTGLLGLCAVLASWHITLRVKEYFFWLLLLQAAVMGVFTSLDLLLFFLFWELELIPMYMLISIWGTGRKEYSAMKFLVFTILGSAFMLVANRRGLSHARRRHIQPRSNCRGPGAVLTYSRHADTAGVAVLAVLCRFRGEAAHLAAAYVAARRAYRRAHRRQRDAGRGSVEDGRVRPAAHQRGAVP